MFPRLHVLFARLVIVSVLVLSAGLSEGRAQSVMPGGGDESPPKAAGGVLTVRGEALVTAVPDMARFTVGVEVQAPTADRAMRANSARTEAILKTLAELGIPARDVQTTQFSVYPVWNNRKGGSGQPLKITGFMASNSLQVRVRDIARLGAVLDALIRAGGNRLQAVSFSHSDPEPLRDRARRKAVKEALRRARLLAEAAGVRLGPVLSLEEVSAGRGPTARMAALAADRPVPIAEGEIGFSATVVLRIAIR